jgi:UDP-glucose 4-epimerase
LGQLSTGLGDVLVTGAAGFIGSHLTDYLIDSGANVVAVDNLVSGNRENIAHSDARRALHRIDMKHPAGLMDLAKGTEVAFHLAANPEVRISFTDPKTFFEENVRATFNILEIIRQVGSVKRLVFASTSAAYGDVAKLPVSEDYPNPRPASFYGTSKLMCEELIANYSALYGFKAASLRLANIIGPRTRHGVIYDFLKKLSARSDELEILGDGTQRKSYLHIKDVVPAFVGSASLAAEGGVVYNVGNDDWITVKEIADIVVGETGLRNVKYRMLPGTKDGRGWVGDVKYLLLDSAKLKGTGWGPSMNSYEAVKETASSLVHELGIGKPKASS